MPELDTTEGNYNLVFCLVTQKNDKGHSVIETVSITSYAQYALSAYEKISVFF